MSVRVPFNRVVPLGRELEYVREAIAGGQLASGGRFGRRCEELLRDVTGAERVLLTTSCTHALEMCSLLLNTGPGDEVILPSFTFPSTANAFVLHGARPVFCDIRKDTFNLDEKLLPDLVNDRTKAIVVVHYAGVGCEMDEIAAVARNRGVPLIEDNAHGLFGKYRGRNLGTFGALATQSFHSTKNLTAGEGGALLINEPAQVERAEILHQKGTDRSRFLRGQVDKYTWVDVGSSYGLPEIPSAFLLGQLECHSSVQKERRRLWETYHRDLGAWAEKENVRLPIVPSECDSSYHLFHLLMRTEGDRDDLAEFLASRGVLAVSHFEPLHTSAMGARFGARKGDCPVTQEVSSRILRLPLFNSMEPPEQEQVIDALLAWRG